MLSGDPPSFQDVPHAFLFTGPKGLGKTSAARIVAKVINCTGRKSEYRNSKSETNTKYKIQSTKYQNIEPCNICEQCTTIANGTNLDVLEIDAASNRGIDEIRDLKDKIRLSPLRAAKKIYIIDEVHMMTAEAFNALLKTLEEPPSHALFMLCTTEAQKVPDTIISRCFHINYSRATADELIRSFKRIVAGEKLSADDDALSQIAKLSDGGFRDGAKILEELANTLRLRPVPDGTGLRSGQENKKITKDLIEEIYQVSSISYQVSEMVEILSKKDAKAGIILIGNLVERGIDLKYFLEQLIESLHILLLEIVGVVTSLKSPIRHPSIKLRTRAQGEQVLSYKLEVEDIKMLFELLSKANADMRYAVLPQLPLELAVIEWSQEGQGTKETKETKETKKIEEGVSVSTLRKHVGNLHKQRALSGDEPKKDQPKTSDTNEDVSLLHYSANGDVSKEWLALLWKNMIVKVKDYNHTLAGVLRGCKLASFDRKQLVIETAYKFHKERLDEMKAKDILDKIATDLTGNPVQVRVELRDK